MSLPGQVVTLQKRIQIIVPERERRLRELTAVAEEAATLRKSGDDPAADRAMKRSARLRTEIAQLTGEMDTLGALVEARLARSAAGVE